MAQLSLRSGSVRPLDDFPLSASVSWVLFTAPTLLAGRQETFHFVGLTLEKRPVDQKLKLDSTLKKLDHFWCPKQHSTTCASESLASYGATLPSLIIWCSTCTFTETVAMSSENIPCYLAPLNRQLFHVHNWSQDAQYNWFPVTQGSPVNHMPLSYNFFHLSNITNN